MRSTDESSTDTRAGLGGRVRRSLRNAGAHLSNGADMVTEGARRDLRLGLGLFRILREAFWRRVLTSFMADHCPQSAGVLTYTTLLSLVPLLTVAFALISAFPALASVREGLESVLFNHFLPSAGNELRDYLDTFLGQAERLRGLGVLFLLVTALLTIATVDRTLNRIWGGSSPHRFLERLVLYWAVLTLGPVFIAIAGVLSSDLLGHLKPAFAIESLRLGWPFLMATTIFALLYGLVPKQPVRVSSAIAGGVFAAILLELAKWGFAFYLNYFPNYEVIYGAFSVIPILLIWLYLFWLIVLLGAQVTYNLDYGRTAPAGEHTGRVRLLVALRLLERLRVAQRSGSALDVSALVKHDPLMAGADQAIQELACMGLAVQTERQHWVLARDLSQVTLADLYYARAYPWPQPLGEEWKAALAKTRLLSVLEEANEQLHRALDVSLEALIAEQRPNAARADHPEAPERAVEGGIRCRT